MIKPTSKMHCKYTTNSHYIYSTYRLLYVLAMSVLHSGFTSTSPIVSAHLFLVKSCWGIPGKRLEWAWTWQNGRSGRRTQPHLWGSFRCIWPGKGSHVTMNLSQPVYLQVFLTRPPLYTYVLFQVCTEVTYPYQFVFRFKWVQRAPYCMTVIYWELQPSVYIKFASDQD